MIDLFFGGAKGSRTPDLLNAIQALSQLSYGPEILPLGFVFFNIGIDNGGNVVLILFDFFQ